MCGNRYNRRGYYVYAVRFLSVNGIIYNYFKICFIHFGFKHHIFR